MEIIMVLVFGIIIGSFLNVCIYRIPNKETENFDRIIIVDEDGNMKEV